MLTKTWYVDIDFDACADVGLNVVFGTAGALVVITVLKV